MALSTTPAKRKKEDHRLPCRSVYLIYLVVELLTALYIQGRIALDSKWYGFNLLCATIAFNLIKLLI